MKMAHLTALCFPETVPTFEAAAPLLLLLDGLVHYRPTESESESAPLFPETSLLQSYAPAPLGDDLDLFLRMVKDMRTHAGEYASNFLSSLAPSLVESYKEESVQQLIGALTKGGTQPLDAPKRDEGFWRTRMLLQLAEEMRHDESEIANHLAKIGDMQQQMMQSLRDEDANELPALPTMPSTPPRLPIRDDLLCRAWCRLFLADHNEQRPTLAATANSEAAELLIDTYTKQSGREPITITNLPLPTLTGMSEQDFLARRDAFRSSATEILTKIDQAIDTGMKTGQASLDNEKIARQWQETLSQHFEAPANGAAQLQITLLANATLADLCQRLGKSEETTSTPGSLHTVLVHLAPLF